MRALSEKKGAHTNQLTPPPPKSAIEVERTQSYTSVERQVEHYKSFKVVFL